VSESGADDVVGVRMYLVVVRGSDVVVRVCDRVRK
jgi:hypothetical protein